ncbi:hypothetical protein [uncultured Sphingomonas sp.]|uniref:hypothetical protein n=1 Tax=uncultured Sphingomonas sp. TaxID=158754 RepID=UPI0035CB9E72
MKLTVLLAAGMLAAGALGATPAEAQRYDHYRPHRGDGYGQRRYGHGQGGYGVRRGYGFHRSYHGYGGGLYGRGRYGPHHGCRRFEYRGRVRRCFY